MPIEYSDEQFVSALTINSNKRDSAVVMVIACWMVILSLWVISHDMQIGSLNLFLNSIQPIWFFYLYAIVCAMGLVTFRPWAWKGTILLFVLHTFWGLYAVYCLMSIWSGYVIDWHNGFFTIDPEVLKTIVCALILVYSIWPIFVILCLIHPHIKSRFSIIDKRFRNLKPTDIKPG